MKRSSLSSENLPETTEHRTETLNSLFDGRILCYQYEHGYRFSIDSVLISHFITPKKNETVLELGSGCGVVGLILLHRHGGNLTSVTGIEKQVDLVAISRKNIVINNLEQKFKIIEGDAGIIKQLIKPESFSLVISNPPFYVHNSGRVSKNLESMTARHQEESTLNCFIDAAAYCLRNRGRIGIIYPAGSLTQLVFEMKKNNIEPKRIQLAYPYPEYRFGAKLVLVEGLKNGGDGAIIEPPLYIHQFKNGPHTEEIEEMYRF